MRFVATTIAVSALALTLCCARAYAVDERIPDADTMAALLAKADQAQPKEQCFLYAEQSERISGPGVRESRFGKTKTWLAFLQ